MSAQHTEAKLALARSIVRGVLDATKPSAQHTPGPWHVSPAIGHPGKHRVQRKNGGAIEIRKSASGKDSIFKTWAAASRVARSLNEDAAVDAELKAKYAGLPPLPSLTLRQTITKATGSQR